MEVKVNSNLKAHRLLTVNNKSLEYASNTPYFHSLIDLNKGQVINAKKSKSKVWIVEVERVVYKGDKVSIGKAGMVKPKGKKDKSIGVALNKAVKGEIVTVKKASERV